MSLSLSPFTRLRLAWPRPSGITLQVSIASLVSLLLVTLGTIITLYTYNNQKADTLKATGKIFQRAADLTSQNIDTIMGPVETFIALSTRLDNIRMADREQRLKQLPYFVQALNSMPWLANVSAGYSNGDFIVVWAMRGNKALMKQVNAPENTAYLLKVIERDPGQVPNERYLYYDKELRLISTDNRFHSGYDPRVRSWYLQAIKHETQIHTTPYRFATTGQTGVTIARRLPGGLGVVAADLVLDSLGNVLGQHKLTPSTQVMLFDDMGDVLAASSTDNLQQLQQWRHGGNVNVLDFHSEILTGMFNESRRRTPGRARLISTGQGQWYGIVTDISANKDWHTWLAIASPLRELTAEARAIARKNLMIASIVVLLSIWLGLIVSRRISASLKKLDFEAERIREFDFDTPLQVSSRIREVDNLAGTMRVMKSAIQRFIEIARSLSAERKMARVLELVLQDAMMVSNADGGSIALISDDNSRLEYVLVRNDRVGVHLGGTSSTAINDDPLPIGSGPGPSKILELHVLGEKKPLAIRELETNGDFETHHACLHHQQDNYHCHSYLAVPLLNRQHETIGLLQLINARERSSDRITGFSQAYIAYVTALSSNAAVALDNNRLLRAQKDLFDSFVQLIAGAIDTKSPYTGGHCQRVPVLAAMLADVACQSEEGVFRDFSLTEDENYELYVSAWLHDCGKVTTPEYIVDKATKLETIYNRIHEIRMRFEVLWRDAEIAYRDAVARQPENEAVLQSERMARHQQLQDDFAFIASCNLGGEYMDPEDIERIRRIATETWTRHFDDRLGLSEDEMQLRKNIPSMQLPVEEHLLADKPEHIVPRIDGGKPFGDNPYGFKMDVPENLANLGEVYNLSVQRGTLTEEDRFRINDHIVQTIKMLKKLPFPKELKRVPEWAGNHHEKLDGTGYPRRLMADDLSIPERIMGIADIFEALTASDRPYKKPKTLSESIRILSFMCKDGHIDQDLFELFLSSGIYRQYAEAYLKPEQIDDVDISVYLSQKPEGQ